MSDNKNSLTKLNDKTDLLVDDILQEDDIDKTKEMISLFNVNIAKKNIARVNTLNNLLDKVNEQAVNRFEKRPDDISNKELLDYMNVINNQIERSTNAVRSINENPAIQFNQQNNVTVNVDNNTTTLDRESRERILKAVQSIVNSSDDEVIDAEIKTIDN